MGFVVHLFAYSADMSIKLRFFEGVREGEESNIPAVISSYIYSEKLSEYPEKMGVPFEKKQIQRIFNLKDVNLLTEADLEWNPQKGESIKHVFRIDGKEFFLVLHPFFRAKDFQFRILVKEQSAGKEVNLLESEIVLPQRKTAVFGFEDGEGQPFFFSLRLTAGEREKPEEASVTKAITSFGDTNYRQKAVRATGDVKPPVLMKSVRPVYPEEARQAGIEGVVILEAITDKTGRVKGIRILQSPSPLLNEASIDALKQWVYKPVFIDGEPREVIFTVTIRFKLK